MCFEKKQRWGRFIGMAIVLIFFAVSANIHATTFQDGLVAYWNLDESGGAIAFDRAPGDLVADNGVYGAGSAAPTQVAGKFGGALSFDEIDDEVLLGSSTDLDIGTKAVTISACTGKVEGPDLGFSSVKHLARGLHNFSLDKAATHRCNAVTALPDHHLCARRPRSGALVAENSRQDEVFSLFKQRAYCLH